LAAKSLPRPAFALQASGSDSVTGLIFIRQGRLLPPSVRHMYDELARQGSLDSDPAQQALLIRLDRLNEELANSDLARKASSLGWLFGSKSQPLVRGLYIWGPR
jgi:cell division protein ZapE